ncbi:MAG: hypothetical protein M3082_11540 [Candidatus Dormibacteraeota bacterium]|nr:hypothetical protein [Candidatus Dormibacteraeota bacterium]
MDSETLLVHQVHPLKLGVDASASVLSNILLWQHRLGPALFARFLPPVVGSALVINLADLETLKRSPRGRYVLEHMPPEATAIRMGGDLVMALGSWRRRPSWIAAGALLVAAGWSHGLLPSRTDR